MPGPLEAGSVWVAARGDGQERRKGEAVPVVKGSWQRSKEWAGGRHVGRWKEPFLFSVWVVCHIQTYTASCSLASGLSSLLQAESLILLSW